MEKEIHEESNQWNTPGYINVALVLQSLISSENEFHFTYKDDFGDFWEKLNKYFEKDQEFSNSEIQTQYNKLKTWVHQTYEKCQKN